MSERRRSRVTVQNASLGTFKARFFTHFKAEQYLEVPAPRPARGRDEILDDERDVEF